MPNRRMDTRRSIRNDNLLTSNVITGIETLGPVAFKKLLRNWWSASDYNSTTGVWPARAGVQAVSITQPVASKRPTKTTVNANFGNKPTVDSDGVDDDLFKTSNATIRIGSNTVGILFQTTGNVAGDYLVGQYAPGGPGTNYQFYRVDEGTDTIITDPSAQTYAAAGVANVHLILFSKNGTQLTVYKDGVSLGVRTMLLYSGTATDFYLFSAGAGYVKASVAELFTIDRAITTAEATALTTFFQSGGYPL